MLRTPFSFRGLILAFGLVAAGLPIALIGELGVVHAISSVNDEIASTREGALATAAVLQLQLDEETGIRGYAATGRREMLQPYDTAKFALPERLAALGNAIPPDAPLNARRALSEVHGLNEQWNATVAAPIIAGARDQDARLLRGKAMIDRFRADIRTLSSYFAERYAAGVALRDRAIRTTTIVGTGAIALIALEVVVFGIVVTRMRFELDRERGFVEMLQTAAAVRPIPPPHLAIGSAYRSATRGARIGGDVYDVYRLDDDRTLIVVADVSGKGLSAAVDTTFVRFALRTLAAEGHAADEVVRRFDALYRAANPAPEAFVSLIAAVHDARDATLAYANAGHEAGWIRRHGTVETLSPTGPVVGLGGFAFGRTTTTLRPGEMLVLATDGLTEARDARGRLAGAARVAEWIAASPAAAPQALADDLVDRVRRYARGRIGDDLAILAVEPVA